MNHTETNELAERICHLTEFGSPLHPNDIIQDIKNVFRSLRQSNKELILGKMDKVKTCGGECGGDCQWCRDINTCKSIVEETLK